MRTTVTVSAFPYPKRFGIVGNFGGMMQARLRHTDSELASQVISFCHKTGLAHEIHFCRNGATIIEVICSNVHLTAMRKLTIRKQIVRLENKLIEL